MKRLSLVSLLALLLILTAFTSTDYVKQGFTAFKAKNYSKAIVYYNKALKINPNNVQALNGKGVTLAFSGQPRQGLVYINKAIKLKPNYLTAYFNAGLANELSGNYYAAISAYQKVIKDEPSNTWSYYGIACSYGRLGDANNAVKYLKKAIGLDKSVKSKARSEEDFKKIRKNKLFIEVLR